MKGFVSTFFMSFVIVAVLAFFLAGVIFSNIWAMIALISFVLAISVTAYMSQEERLEALEKKLELLEVKEAADE